MAADGLLLMPLQPGRPGGRRLVVAGLILISFFGWWIFFVYDSVANIAHDLAMDNARRNFLGCFGIAMALATVPMVIGAFRWRGDRRMTHPSQPVPPEAAALTAIHWPAGKRGKSRGASNIQMLAETSLRCVIDAELARWAAEMRLPQGLIEPREFIPGRAQGSIRTVFRCLLAAPVVLLVVAIITATMWGNFGPWIALPTAAVLLVWMFGAAMASHPTCQRGLASVPMLGRISRGEFGRKRCLVGPGWVRRGRQVWKVGEDLMIVRRRARVRECDVLEVMMAGRAGRRRWTVAGTSDPMLHRLWECWMHPDPRPEFASSDLS